MKRQSQLQHKLRESVPFPTQPLIELCGDRRLLVEHHRGMCAYSRERICIKVQYGMIEILGDGLEIACIRQRQLLITGRIDTVNLSRRG